MLSDKPEEAQGEAVKSSKFPEQQITRALRMAESGTPMVDVCCQIGMSEATYQPIDLTLDKQILQEVVRKRR